MSVMSAPVELQAAGPKSGRPALVFRSPSPVLFTTRDAKRFLVDAPEDYLQEALPMAVITNWAAGLGK